MRDYSAFQESGRYLSGAERKKEIIIGGSRFIVKFQKNSEIGLTFNHVSEYLGSHIFQSAGIPVQETALGTFGQQNVVVMKNFLSDDEVLVPFNDVGESSLERDKELYHYSYEDIISMLEENRKSTAVQETVERFWDMFIIDALIGNFDRHGGNWGFIKKDDRYRIAPVYDNGSSLFPKLNSDTKLADVLNSEEELNRRIYTFPTSHIKHHNRKSSYYEIIHSRQYPQCNEALRRMMNRISLDRINSIIDAIPAISELRSQFYKRILKLRYEKILEASYLAL